MFHLFSLITAKQNLPHQTLLFPGSRGSPSSVVTLAMEACGEMRFPEARTASLTVMRGDSVPHKLPLEPEGSLRWLWHGDEGRGKRGGWSCPLILLA